MLSGAPAPVCLKSVFLYHWPHELLLTKSIPFEGICSYLPSFLYLPRYPGPWKHPHLSPQARAPHLDIGREGLRRPCWHVLRGLGAVRGTSCVFFSPSSCHRFPFRFHFLHECLLSPCSHFSLLKGLFLLGILNKQYLIHFFYVIEGCIHL